MIVTKIMYVYIHKNCRNYLDPTPVTKLTFRPSQNKHITFACGFLKLGYLLVGVGTVGSCLGWLRSATCVFS